MFFVLGGQHGLLGVPVAGDAVNVLGVIFFQLVQVALYFFGEGLVVHGFSGGCIVHDDDVGGVIATEGAFFELSGFDGVATRVEPAGLAEIVGESLTHHAESADQHNHDGEDELPVALNEFAPFAKHAVSPWRAGRR